MTPEYIRILRRDAVFVQGREELMKRMDTEQRRKSFQEVEVWFKKKYPYYNWRDWVPEEKKERAV